MGRMRTGVMAIATSVLVVVAACTSNPPSATPTPAAAASEGAPSAAASGVAPTSGAPSPAAPTEAPPTEAPPTEAPASEAPGGPTPGASVSASAGAPIVNSMQVVHTASCTSDNGTGTVGMVRITWDASGTTGIRLSIDPPSPDVAYDYPFADYGPSGFADVPFSCDPPNHDAKGAYHLYVVTTIKVGGHAFYRFAKVYDATPSAT